MVGPFKTAPGGLTHLLVAVDKFTKWIEAKPIKKLDGSSTIKFFNEIITRYGVPHSIITDNGTNFVKGVFADYCGQKGIRLDLASVAHPQTNGQVEKANGLILADIKPRLVEPLERSAGCWVEELPSVLWSLCTTPNRSVGFTPFFLVYGAEGCCPQILSLTRPELSNTWRSKQKKLAKMALTSSRRHENRLWPDHRSISSSCDDTTAEKFARSRFTKEISYSGWSKAPRACTSCLLPGRDRSLSAGCWAMGHITSSTHKSLERTRQITLTRRPSIPGMSVS
jgi:hypothetical protein